MSDTRRFLELDAKARLVATAVLVALPITSAVAGWTFVQLWNHEGRLTTIEASRYTRGDAEAERRVAERERRDLERILIRQESKLVEIDKKLAELLAKEQTR